MLAMRIRNFRWIARNTWMLLAVFSLIGAATAAPAAFQEKLLQLDINQQQINETVMLLEDDAGALYLASSDIQRWRLREPSPDTGITYQGARYFPIVALQVVRQRYDAKALTLAIDLAADAFEGTDRISQAETSPAPQRSGPGGFFNYELFGASSVDSQQRSGQFELGYFNASGVGLTGVFVNHLADRPVPIRLETSWIRDSPETLESWRYGDAISTPGSWGQSVRFGGVQFATNFATQPSLATFTPQTVAGQAAMPSTVDIFVNNALVSRQTVPPGPFTVANLPVVTGSGEVRLVVRDMFGREQVITQPFYASQSLLRVGLSSFAYEAGFLRQDFGLQSDNYGPWMASGTFRHGMTEHLTTEVHAQASAGQATFGLGGDVLVAKLGTLSAYLAASSKGAESGALAVLGLDRSTATWSFGARSQISTDGFVQVGDAPGHAWPSQLQSANMSYAFGSLGSLGAAYIRQMRNQGPEVRVLSVSYSLGLAGSASLGISALANLSGEQNSQLLVSLTLPIGEFLTASTTAQASRNRGVGTDTDLAATVGRNLPSGSGYGYRVQLRNEQSVQGSLALQNDVGTYTFDALQNHGQSAGQVSVAGGLAVLDGKVFASRRMDQSFAVASVTGFSGVHVMADNQPVGQTNADGNALIPRLRPYDRNMISIDQRDLPMDAEIGSLSVRATPYFRSGILVPFPVKRASAATFSVTLDDGGPLPAGAVITNANTPTSALLGSNGDVYVADLQKQNPMTIQWRSQQCTFDVPYTRSDDPLPDLGTFVCHGVNR